MPVDYFKFACTAPLAASILPPILVLLLCVIAGLGTVILLPGRAEPALRKIGGGLLLAVLGMFGAVLARQTGGRNTDSAYFWIFSAIGIISAARVVTHRKPVYCALYFILTVLATAGLFILLQAEFLAAAVVLIYAGAILVTYLFVIMLAQQSQRVAAVTAGQECDRVSRQPFLGSAVGLMLTGILLVVLFDRAPFPLFLSGSSGAGRATAPFAEFARSLFTWQAVSLELAGVILTVAVVGAVVIARRRLLPGAQHAQQSSDDQPAVILAGPPVPQEDDPRALPISGTRDPRTKAYPEK